MVNGIMMLLSFFACRVMLFPILYWWYSSILGLSLISTIISIPCWVHAATISLWLPQLFWFNKMLRGSLKVIRGRKTLSEDSPVPSNIASGVQTGHIAGQTEGSEDDIETREKLE